MEGRQSMEEVHAGNGAKSPVATMPEQQSDYVNRPAGEMDMLIGFFLMNGFCIFFFLLFGMCVIFSCLRRRPKMLRQEKEEELPPVRKSTSNFKSLVTKAMKTADFKGMKGEDIESNKKETSVTADGEKIQVNVLSSGSRKSSRRNSQLVIEAEICEQNEQSSVIRGNLLGPLTFDDLYYT